MVETKDIEALNLELDNRLDDLFGETDILLPDAGEENPKEDYPLADLKNTILSIDWEITDEVLDTLVQQIKDLLTTYEDDKIIKTFLQILNSLGNYIRVHRGKAPPKTFRILNSVFSSLDKVLVSEDMEESAKKKLLRAEMKSYKELRELTAKSPKTTAKKKGKSKAAASDTEEKDPVIRLEETSERRAEKKKTAALEAKKEEPAVALEIEAKEDAPLLEEDETELELSLPEAETAKAPDTRPKAEPETGPTAEPETLLEIESETPSKAEPETLLEVEPETRSKAEPETLLEVEPETPSKAEPETILDIEPETRSQAELETRSKVEPEMRSKAEDAPRSKAEPDDTEPRVAPDSSAAALAEAVDEIKRYIHIEIKALKKEIRLLRKQK